MIFLKLLLSGNLIYITTMAIAIPINNISERARNRALIDQSSDYVLPIHYNVNLELNDEYLIGEYVITIYITHVTQQINFHMDPMNTRENMRLEKLLYNSKGNYNIISTNYIAKDIVVLKFENVLLTGIYNLKINIKIPINIVKNSIGYSYINNDGNKEWLITTGVHTRKQQIFPFWNPELKTIFNVSIMHHRKYTVLSNIPKRESDQILNDMRTYYENVLISVDNIAFVISEFQHIGLTDTISMWCKSQFVPHINFALHVIKNVTMYLENYWQNSKGFFKWTLVSSEKKVDHVIIPNLQDEVKPILGFVFYREADIIYNEEMDPSERKMIIAPLIARKMIQKYIGNLLDPSYKFQLWLNEGFSIFQQVYIIDEILPDFRMMDLFIVQFQHELLDLNTYFDTNSVIGCDCPENYIYSFLSHIKGSIIWRMLERILSPNIFSKGINMYLDIQYTEMERTSDSLWKAIQNVIDELDSKYQFNVRSTVDSWSVQRCFPVLKVRRNYLSNVTIISVEFQNKLDENQYYIPVTYTTESKPNFTIIWSNIRWLTSSNSPIELLLGNDQWIILNLQQAGYYRVNYDTENWLKIARYLNSEEYSNIHVLNRAQIIDDAFYFAIKKTIKFSLFWRLATYLQKEKDYIAWYPMIKAFEFMSNMLVFFEFFPQFHNIKKMKEPLNVMWNLFDESTNDDHINCLKLELAKWKCIINDTTCTLWANYVLQWHLRNPEENKLLPGWKRWTYCNGLKMANSDTWDKVFNKSREETDHIILECLAYIENSEIIINYLKRLPVDLYIFWRNLPYPQSKSKKEAEILITNIFLYTLTRNTKHMLEDILNNFGEILDYNWYMNKITALTVIINNVYSAEQLDKIKEFIKKEFREPIFFDIEWKIETRRFEIGRQIQYLQSVFID